MSRADHADWCNVLHPAGESPCTRRVSGALGTSSTQVLELLAPGTRVADAMHDLWTKREDGTWWYAPEGYGLSAEDLLRVWGPVKIITKEFI